MWGGIIIQILSWDHRWSILAELPLHILHLRHPSTVSHPRSGSLLDLQKYRWMWVCCRHFLVDLVKPSLHPMASSGPMVSQPSSGSTSANPPLHWPHQQYRWLSLADSPFGCILGSDDPTLLEAWRGALSSEQFLYTVSILLINSHTIPSGPFVTL